MLCICDLQICHGKHIILPFNSFRSPENSSIKQKMVYSASQDKFKKDLGPGIGTFVQANDRDDIQWENVLERVTKFL